MSTTEKTASMRTPLSRVRNLGSAKAGTSDFFRQRLTAIGLVLLIVPMVIIIMTMLGRNYAATAQILGSPIIDIVMILFVIASVLHMKIGMQVILEDYVHSEKLKLAAIIANNFFSLAVGLASIYAILKLSSGV
jgi:succinate dehydrogenase / fumarate reductase membrane anchor subunit